MLKYDLISKPEHYVGDREIQPIDVIENWHLCHHLSCVVKYIARYGRKTNAFQACPHESGEQGMYFRSSLSRGQASKSGVVFNA